MNSLFVKILFWVGIVMLSVYVLQLFGWQTDEIVALSYLVIAGAWMRQRDNLRYFYLDKIEVIEKERDELKTKNRELSVELEHSRDEVKRLRQEIGAESDEDIEEILYED